MDFLIQHIETIALAVALVSCGVHIGQDGVAPLAGYVTGIVFGGIATYVTFIH